MHYFTYGEFALLLPKSFNQTAEAERRSVVNHCTLYISIYKTKSLDIKELQRIQMNDGINYYLQSLSVNSVDEDDRSSPDSFLSNLRILRMRIGLERLDGRHATHVDRNVVSFVNSRVSVE